MCVCVCVCLCARARVCVSKDDTNVRGDCGRALDKPGALAQGGQVTLLKCARTESFQRTRESFQHARAGKMRFSP